MKKNECFREGDGYSLFTKTKRIIQLTCLLILTTTMMLSASTYSQQTKLELAFEEITIGELFHEIEEQTEFRFAYSNSRLDPTQKVSVNVKDEVLEDLLDNVLKNRNLSYKVIDKYVVITDAKPGKNKPSQQEKKEKTITGKVTDDDGMSLPGVTVVAKGTTIGVITDIDGMYSIKLPEDVNTLIFSYIGMRSQEISVEGKTVIDISLESESISLDEVVAIGYGYQKKATLTGAVSNIRAEDIESIPTSNLSNVLAGRMSGLLVTQTTGLPGIASEMSVRDKGTWNSNPPLFVIDGVIRGKADFDRLDPNEVAEISVLKDAASAAIYGARSAGGVVLVETKKGEAGKPRINYSYTYSVEEPTILPDIIEDAEETALLGNEALYNTLGDNANTNAEWWSKDELDWLQTLNGGKINNWLDYAYKDPTTEKHSLSISGGSKNIRYYMGGSIFGQTGFMESISYDKYNLRGNIEADVTKDLTIGLQLSKINSKRNKYYGGNDNGSDSLSDSWNKLFYFGWAMPAYIDGLPVNYNWGPGHAVETPLKGGYYDEKINSEEALVTLSYKFPLIKGLKFNLLYSNNTLNQMDKVFGRNYPLYTFVTNGYIFTDEVKSVGINTRPRKEFLEEAFRLYNEYQLNGSVSYSAKVKKHNINAMFVYEQWESKTYKMNGMRETFPLLLKDQWLATSNELENRSVGGSENENGRMSYIGRANYDYDEKYLLSVTARYDGSVKFAPGKRWGLFPSVSAGWRISEEPFFKENISVIDYLKLRGSVGSQGNDRIANWTWQETYNLSGGFLFGTDSKLSQSQGVQYGGISNADVTWEKATTYNLGLDATLFNGWLSFTGDLWKRNTTDILGNRILSVPSTFGGSLPPENYGEVESQGFEVELGVKNSIGRNFNYWINGNFSYATNKVLVKDFAENGKEVDNPIGRSLDYMKGVVYTDLIRSQEELDAILAENPDYRIFGQKPLVGMPNFEDVNGPEDDGVPDGIIDGNDKQILNERSTPPYIAGLTTGFRWRNLRVEAFFQGAYGYKTFYSGIGQNIRHNNKHSVFAHWQDRFVAEDVTLTDPDGTVLGVIPANPDGQLPAVGKWNTAMSKVTRSQSTFWLYDNSYTRLKNLNIALALPKNMVKKAGFTNIDIFFNGTNLLTFGMLAKNKLYDPELNQTVDYPNMKVYSFGIKAAL